MAETALFAGPALRRLRKREGLTQAAMAERLAISPSYLNLIERNQRAISARVMVQLVDIFDFDPRTLREDESIGGVDGLMRRLADERFADFKIDREEAVEFLGSTPQIAAAFVRLFDTAGRNAFEEEDPLVQSRQEIERWRNHFSDLDDRAEVIADDLRLSSGDLAAGLSERLRERHQISVRILPRDVMPEASRRLDLHARQLQLSEMLSPASRNFQIAMQITLLEEQEAIAAIVAGSRLQNEAARRLFERHLVSYFAAAMLMPYSRFLRACEATGYDLPVLQRRFGTSFEQLAHRLTTLQRIGQRGLPFFMARVDRAGQFSKRFSGASGAQLLDSDSSCPLWNIHQAFERAGTLCMQQVRIDTRGSGKGHWFTIARAVDGSGTTGESRFAIVVGLEAKLASNLAQARGFSLREDEALSMGLGCERCFIADCRQRSLPPRGAVLDFDRNVRGVTPYSFGESRD